MEITPEISAWQAFQTCVESSEWLNIPALEVMFLELVKFHWASPENHSLLRPHLECYTWGAQEPSKSVDIRSAHDGGQGSADRAPMIRVDVVQEGAMEQITMNNVVGTSEDGGTLYYGWRCTAKVTVAHTMPSKFLATHAATSTLFLLAAAERVLLSRYANQVTGWHLLGLSPPAMSKDNPRTYRVDSMAKLVFTFLVAVNSETHRLNSLDISLTPA